MQITEIISPDFSKLGNVIPEGYQYYKKKVSSGEILHLPGASFKWYNLFPSNAELTQPQINEAKDFLISLTQNQAISFKGELGFIILHRAGEYLLLLVTTWRNTNEMWESIYLKKVDEGKNYTAIKFEEDHKGTYCVWELGPVWYERNAWVRFIESKRDTDAKLKYLNDTFMGEI